MGATNHTANYDLPQWIGTDKPTFLGDLNDAFLKIDTGMKTNQSEISGAASDAGNALAKATSAEQAVNTLTPLVNTASENASQALTTANNAASTANTANTNANAAKTITDQISVGGGWTTFTNCTLNEKTFTPNSVISGLGHNLDPALKVSYNSTLQLMTFVGSLSVSENGDSWILLCTLPSGIPKPTTERGLVNFGWYVAGYNNLFQVRYAYMDVSGRIYLNGTLSPGSYWIQSTYVTRGWFN